MKVYLIYRNDTFFAYTSDKKYLKEFLKSRDDSYSYIKMDSEDISDSVKESNYFDISKLVTKTIQGYTYILTEDEEQCLMEYLFDEMAGFHFFLYELINDIEKCKFDRKEKELVLDALELGLAKLESVPDDFHEIAYETVFDMRKVMSKHLEIKPVKNNALKTLW